TGVLLTIGTSPTNTSFAFDNKVDIQGLWPMQLASVVHANHYWTWGLLGACGVAACGLLGTSTRKRYLVLLLALVSLTDVGNYLYHRTIIQQHATVSSLYQYIKANYATTTCIGFTPTVDSNERFNLYSYYLHGYDLKKMTLHQWQQSCDGPYFTYSPGTADLPGLQISGVEVSTNLYMLTRVNEKNITPSQQSRVLRFE
ncbi:MAG TPA: hypothetical protein VMB52_01455, partial [Verrucomicrobiae bacterium]|nr:hypothetical protein [Verrucomicrobiae bacterium]